MTKEISKSLRSALMVVLAVVALIGSFTMVSATEKTSLNEMISSEVVFDASANTASIKFDLSNVVPTQYEVLAIESHNQEALDLANPVFGVAANGIYEFNVSYKEVNQEVVEQEVKSEIIEVTVSDFKEEIQEEVQEQEPQTRTLPVKPGTVIHGAHERSTDANTPATDTTNFKESFHITNTTGAIKFLGDSVIQLGNKYLETHVTTYSSRSIDPRCITPVTETRYYAKFVAVSKYKMNFNENFDVKATMTDRANVADGFTMGFQTNPNYESHLAVAGGLMAYKTNYLPINGVQNGVVFEVDYHDNTTAYGDNGLGAKHLSINTTDGQGNITNVAATQKNVAFGNGGMVNYNASWRIDDAATGRGTLTFVYGNYTLKYSNFYPHKQFGGSINNVASTYLTYTGVLLKDWGSTNQPYNFSLIQVDALKDSVDAKNGFIKESEAKALTNQNGLIPFNKATATSKDGKPATPTASTPSWADIKAGKTGLYDVTYTYNAASKAVKLNVIGDDWPVPPSGEFALAASDGSMTQTQARAITKLQDLAPYNNARVIMADGSVVAVNIETPQLATIQSGRVGSYYISYSYGTGANYVEKMVKLDVKADTPHIINAENGLIDTNVAVTLTSMNQLVPFNNATVTTNEGGVAVPNVATTDWSNIQAGVLGTYNVTYSYGAGTTLGTKTVELRVVRGVSPEGLFALDARNGSISQTGAKALSNPESLIPLNNAKVTLKNGTEVAPTVTVLPTDWLAMKSGTLGTYPVLYSYRIGTDYMQKQVLVTIFEDGGIISPEGDFILNARNTIISESEAKALVDANGLIAYNKGKVTHVDGSTAPLPSVNAPQFAAIKAGTIGTYDVTYANGVGTNLTQKTVKVVVVKEDSIISAERAYALYAENSLMTQEDGKKLANVEALIAKSNAVVTLSDGSTTKPSISMSTAHFNAIKAGTPGKYAATFTYKELEKRTEVQVSQEYYLCYKFDFNEDGRIDLQDYAEFMIIYNNGGKGATVREMLLADYNEDGRVDLQDLAELRFFISSPNKKPPMVQIPI